MPEELAAQTTETTATETSTETVPENPWAPVEAAGVKPEDAIKVAQYREQLKGFNELTAGRVKAFQHLRDAGFSGEDALAVVQLGLKARENKIQFASDTPPTEPEAPPAALTREEAEKLWEDKFNAVRTSDRQEQEQRDIRAAAKAAGIDPSGEQWAVLHEPLLHAQLDKLTKTEDGSYAFATSEIIGTAIENVKGLLGSRDAQAAADAQGVQEKNPLPGSAGSGARPPESPSILGLSEMERKKAIAEMVEAELAAIQGA